MSIERKRKADVLGRVESSSKLGRGSLSGWTTCPLCPTGRKKLFALGRGIAAHIQAVHTPWNTNKANGDASVEVARVPTSQEEEDWNERVLKILSSLEQNREGKSGLDRAGNPCKSYRESLPPLIQAAADGNFDFLRNEIHNAEKEGNLEEVLNLRDRNGSSAEHWAAGGGHIECLKLLLELRDKITSSSSSVAENSSDFSDKVQQKKMRRRDGKTCLHYAARNGHLDCIRFLIQERGCPVHVKSGDGTTPLHMACYGVHKKVVHYLIEKGADVHQVNDWECSVAHWLAMSPLSNEDDMIALCQYLFQTHKVSFITAQRQGHTPIHKAAQKLNRTFLEWLSKSKNHGGPGLLPSERQFASRPDNGGHRPSEIWLSVGGDETFAHWIKDTFEL
jgi:ankyrin repeat protein